MITNFFITFIKMFLFNYCTSFVFFKIRKYKEYNSFVKRMSILFNIIIALLYATGYEMLKLQNAAISNIVCYIIYCFIISVLVNSNIKQSLESTIISISITYIGMLVATFIAFIFFNLIKLDINKHTIIEYVTIGITDLGLVYLFFRIKRFKDGFSFLEKKSTRKNIVIIMCLVIITISIMLGLNYSTWTESIFIIAVIVGGIIMLNWIKTSITKYYKERMKDRIVEIQRGQLKEKDEIISNLNKELSNVLEINHKYNKRLSAMEKAVGNFGNKLSLNEEFSKEYSDILDSLKDLSKEYKQEFENHNILPKTNIFSIDNLLDYMKTESIRNNIEFELEINDNINELIEKHIKKNKLETLLGDHIADAIAAINASDSSDRKIKVIMGKDKEFYKISVLDTGIEFEIETLLKLGLERITTHKDSGGTGIGFMTTFETLKECKASLVIEEYNNKKDYTKSVNIIFDGRSEYNIKSYRAGKINHKTRIIE